MGIVKTHRSVAESLAEVTRSQLAPKSAVTACYTGLSALLQPRHGDAYVPSKECCLLQRAGASL